MKRLFLGLLTMVLLAAACTADSETDDDESSGASESATDPASPESISQVDYLVQANAACRLMNQRIEALPDPEGPQDLLALLQENRAIIQSTLDELRALPQPEGQAGILENLFGMVDDILALADEQIALVESGDIAAADALNAQITAVADRANAAFIDYGMDVCGES